MKRSTSVPLQKLSKTLNQLRLLVRFCNLFSYEKHQTLRSQRRKLVVSFRTQAVKLHKNFDHFSIVCWWTRKTFEVDSTWNYLHLDWINFYRNDIEMTCIETTGNLSATSHLLVSQERFPNSLPAWLLGDYSKITCYSQLRECFRSPHRLIVVLDTTLTQFYGPPQNIL